jgi:hypothetical protein
VVDTKIVSSYNITVIAMKYLLKLALLTLVAVPVLYTGSALADADEMAKLPSSSVFSCLLCHETDTGGAFNAFGDDFLKNGGLWSYDLAVIDSDDDGCTNGAELGDVDGNGVLDEGVTKESSNPGVDGDCNSASNINDDVTWGTLKELFNSR